jgi:hypothetical protein
MGLRQDNNHKLGTKSLLLSNDIPGVIEPLSGFQQGIASERNKLLTFSICDP